MDTPTATAAITSATPTTHAERSKLAVRQPIARQLSNDNQHDTATQITGAQYRNR